MMRKACAASGLAAAAAASALMITSPASAQNPAAANGVSASAIRDSGNLSGLLTGRGFIPRDDDTTSVGGVGNITGSSRSSGGVRDSAVAGSGNVRDSYVDTGDEGYDYGD